MSQLKIKQGNTWVGIPAGGVGVPAGGSEGQYLKKSSSTDYATEWGNFDKTELLWTNSSPSSNRSNFNVALDLSKYGVILVVFRYDTSSTLAITRMTPVGETTYWTCAIWGNKYENHSRAFKATSTGVQFDGCYDGSTAEPSKLIPEYIYGIR